MYTLLLFILRELSMVLGLILITTELSSLSLELDLELQTLEQIPIVIQMILPFGHEVRIIFKSGQDVISVLQILPIGILLLQFVHKLEMDTSSNLLVMTHFQYLEQLQQPELFQILELAYLLLHERRYQ